MFLNHIKTVENFSDLKNDKYDKYDRYDMTKVSEILVRFFQFIDMQLFADIAQL